MRRALLNLLVFIVLVDVNSTVSAATLTYHFSGTFTQNVAGGVVPSTAHGRAIPLPSVKEGQPFHGMLSYSTNQLQTWNVTENEGSYTLQGLSVSFGGNVLHMGIGPFGMHLENDAFGLDRISIAGADDTGFALLNGETVRAVTSIALVDVDGQAVNSVVLGMLPDLLSFEQRRLQIYITGYFEPDFGIMYHGEITRAHADASSWCSSAICIRINRRRIYVLEKAEGVSG